MNKRIKELMEKAGIHENQYTAEKFAELIVRECIDLLPDACQANNGCHASWVIKEHFGVEP